MWYNKFKYIKSEISEESQNILDRSGFEVVEKEFVGPYEIYLVYNKYVNIYQIGLQTNKTQFTNIEDQNSKQEIPVGSGMEIPKILSSIVSKWKQQYGDIYVGSENPDKNKKYMNILKYLGFEPRKKNIYGQERYII